MGDSLQWKHIIKDQVDLRWKQMLFMSEVDSCQLILIWLLWSDEFQGDSVRLQWAGWMAMDVWQWNIFVFYIFDMFPIKMPLTSLTQRNPGRF